MAVYPLAYSYYDIPASPAFAAGRRAPRPVLRLALVNGAQQFSCYAIIDSGADHCIFPYSFMTPLGINALNAPTEVCGGVGNNGIPAHFANIEIDMQGIIKFPVYAGFTAGLEAWGIGLLGQVGFFDRFNVGFRLGPDKACYIEVP